MVIYIAGLILLITVILFAVYRRIDPFQTTLMSGTSTVQDFINLTIKLIKQITDQKQRLDSKPEFDDTLSKTKLDELAIQYEIKDDVVTVKTKPISKALSTSSQELLDILTPLETEYKKLNPTLKLKEIITKEEDIQNINNGFVFFQTLLNKRESYITSKLGSRKAPVDMNELYDAVKSPQVEDVDMTDTDGKAPATTATSSKEMEDRIAKSVVTQIKDSLLAERSTHNIQTDMSCPYASYGSDGIAQGKEFVEAKPSPTPDMSEYIRKDSIPCWNCSLP